MARRVHLFRRHQVAVLCLAVLLPAGVACGPTAEQLESRQAERASSADASETAAPPQAIPTAEPEPELSSPPLQVGVSGAQTGMAPEVQEACQWLLRRDTAPFPDAGACIAAAMVAGQGGRQSITTSSSWLPPGSYSMEFRTAPGFSMNLTGQDGGLEVSVDGTERTLRTGDSSVGADADGGPEEAYAAVLVDAAELTSNPARLGSLLESARPAVIEYDTDYNGVRATRLTAVIEAAEPDGFSGSLTMVLDDLYRPLLIEYAGTTRGIRSSVIAAVTDWGTGGALR